jgi:hypothetical protein
VTARGAAALIVALALALAAPVGAHAAAPKAGAAAKPGAGKPGAERKSHTPRRCARWRAARRAHARRGSCRRARLSLRAAPRTFDRLLDVGARSSPSAGGPGQAPAPAPGAPSAPGAPTAPEPLPDYVAVTATEWRLALSRPLVGAGLVTIELRNKGEDPHDLVVTPEGAGQPVFRFPETDPGGYPAAGMQLAAGRYTLFCSLAGHAAAGMTATLRVEPQP